MLKQFSCTVDVLKCPFPHMPTSLPSLLNHLVTSYRANLHALKEDFHFLYSAFLMFSWKQEGHLIVNPCASSREYLRDTLHDPKSLSLKSPNSFRHDLLINIDLGDFKGSFKDALLLL